MAITPRSFLRNPLLIALIALSIPASALLWSSLCGSQCHRSKAKVEVQRTIVPPAPPVVVHKTAPAKQLPGWLGVRIQTMNPELAQSLDLPANHRGVLVLDVQKGMPSERAGFQDRDVITHLEGKLVTSACDFSKRIRATAPGSLVRVRVIRDGRALLLHPELTTAPRCRGGCSK